MVGGHAKLSNPDADPILKAAAYDDTNVVFVHSGLAFLVPYSSIDTSMIELACNEKGCALIPKDDDPTNDIMTPQKHLN